MISTSRTSFAFILLEKNDPGALENPKTKSKLNQSFYPLNYPFLPLFNRKLKDGSLDSKKTTLLRLKNCNHYS
jgi:hypothetical protein